ncbi:c-type cytochrome [Deinococcus daejeonensis]|uniref:Cytochrome c n=1 Tax=Deinococcus daejeonensis TaxID=1007098 RepID=A0ABQ2IZG8_9DEIO|nr:c-type cytochrome [Deinococcus daejeonensis]GGN35693.1 cytochrome c [Deinococcus daejeonensis]
MNRRSLPAALLLVTPLLAGVAALAQTTPAPTTPAQTSAAATTLKAGPADFTRGEAIAASCSGCHGPTGRAPVLKGEPAVQIQNALLAFRSGTRRNGTMQGVAGRLSDQDIADVAAFYAGPPPTPAPATPPAAPTPAPPSTSTAAPAPGALGRTLYLEGAPARDVLACAVCHGEDGRGADAVGIPAIAGLSAASVLETLRAYHAMPPVGIAYPDAMRIAVKPLNDADMTAIAQFVTTLK